MCGEVHQPEKSLRQRASWGNASNLPLIHLKSPQCLCKLTGPTFSRSVVSSGRYTYTCKMIQRAGSVQLHKPLHVQFHTGFIPKASKGSASGQQPPPASETFEGRWLYSSRVFPFDPDLDSQGFHLPQVLCPGALLKVQIVLWTM